MWLHVQCLQQQHCELLCLGDNINSNKLADGAVLTPKRTGGVQEEGQKEDRAAVQSRVQSSK